jgi:hypothetical protein
MRIAPESIMFCYGFRSLAPVQGLHGRGLETANMGMWSRQRPTSARKNLYRAKSRVTALTSNVGGAVMPLAGIR